MMEDAKNLYTTQEIAESANLSKQTVLNYVKDGVITPAMQLAHGQCYFDEATVVTLMTISCAKDYRNNTLAVCFGNEEDCASFEETYNRFLKEQGIPRVDNLTKYLMDCREISKSNEGHKRLCMIDSINETIHACENEMKDLSGELQKRLLTNPDIEDMAVIIENRNNLVKKKQEIKELLNEHDRIIFNAELQWFALKQDRIEERYSIADMRRLLEELKNLPQDGTIEYEPKKPAVKSVWRKTEQRYLRDYTKRYMKERLAKGYVAIWCTDGQSNGGIYQLLTKAVNPCIRRIEIYCMDSITDEMQQIIDFLQEIKDVVFKSEI